MRKLIVELYLKNNSYGKIAETLGKSKSTIQSVIKRWKESGSTVARRQSGRPISFTKRDENRLTRILKANTGATTKNIFELYNNAPRKLSRRTLYRTLKRLGYVRRSIRKSVVIRSKNLVARKKWARSRKNWTIESWKRFIFSDECSVVIGKDNRMYSWRRIDEKDSPHLVCPPRNRKFSVMVWGAITFSGERTLNWVKGNIDSQKYIEVLQESLLPLIEHNFSDGEYTFMQDNAPVHTSRLTRDWLDSKGIHPTIWSPQSPDLNIIENVWRDVKVKLAKVEAPITSASDLHATVERCFYDVTSQLIKDLYISLPRRLKSCIKMKGHITKYRQYI